MNELSEVTVTSVINLNIMILPGLALTKNYNELKDYSPNLER
jgi:hypothetical protein